MAFHCISQWCRFFDFKRWFSYYFSSFFRSNLISNAKNSDNSRGAVFEHVIASDIYLQTTNLWYIHLPIYWGKTNHLTFVYKRNNRQQHNFFVFYHPYKICHRLRTELDYIFYELFMSCLCKQTHKWFLSPAFFWLDYHRLISENTCLYLYGVW